MAVIFKIILRLVLVGNVADDDDNKDNDSEKDADGVHYSSLGKVRGAEGFLIFVCLIIPTSTIL